MKKGFLFGLGILMAGITFAVVNNITGVGSKTAGGTVSADDINSITGTMAGFYNDSETGFVGIGVPNPAVKLDVDGTIRANEICDETGENCKDISSGWGSTSTSTSTSEYWQASTGEGIYYSISTGDTKVGIGTTDPTETLDVNGMIRLRDTDKGICKEDNVGVIVYEEFDAGYFYGCRRTVGGTYEWTSFGVAP